MIVEHEGARKSLEQLRRDFIRHIDWKIALVEAGVFTAIHDKQFSDWQQKEVARLTQWKYEADLQGADADDLMREVFADFSTRAQHAAIIVTGIEYVKALDPRWIKQF